VAVPDLFGEAEVVDAAASVAGAVTAISTLTAISDQLAHARRWATVFPLSSPPAIRSDADPARTVGGTDHANSQM
jgi:hypothetical protein